MDGFKDIYIISLGGQHKIWTLWKRFIVQFTTGIEERYYYIQNLAMDADEALAKAELISNGKCDIVWDYDSDITLNQRGLRASNKIFDGETVTWGKQFCGQPITEVLKDEFGIKYLAFGYGFPAPKYTRQCDINCLNYVRELPEIKEYLAEIEKEKNRADREKKRLLKKITSSEYLGDVGETLEVKVTVTDVFSFQGNYGMSWCFKMVDKNNNRLLAYTTSKHFIGYWDSSNVVKKSDVFINGVEKGDKITISGEVKNHYTRDEEFKLSDGNCIVAEGVKQTQITRIKRGV